MGMFDFIYSQRPLPECELPPGTAFQTKDLDCLLGHYVITAEGRLLRCRSVDEESVDLVGAVDTEHHGDIRFYGGEPRGRRYEFVARFTDGVSVWVKRNLKAEQAVRELVEKIGS